MGRRSPDGRGSKDSIRRRFEKQTKKLRAREDAAQYERPGDGRPGESRTERTRRDSRSGPEGPGGGEDHEGDRFDDRPSFEPIRRGGQQGGRAGRRRTTSAKNCGTGIVTAVDRGLVAVDLEDVGPIRARPLQLAIPDPAQTPVVGDTVDISERRDVYRVEAVHPRETVLCRADATGSGAPRVLAANVDVGVIVVAMNDPHPGLVERMRIALQRGGVRSEVVINKADLAGDQARVAACGALSFLDAEGSPAIVTSVVSGEGLERLRRSLAGKTCVFVGHSGVGKSTLLNALDPEGDRITQEVREGDGKGRHTTTRSELRRLADGTRVIDTPGVRGFGLHDVTEEDVRACFPELATLPCRFRDCRHQGDDGCAADLAVRSGQVDGGRLARFRRVIRSLEEPT